MEFTINNLQYFKFPHTIHRNLSSKSFQHTSLRPVPPTSTKQYSQRVTVWGEQVAGAAKK